MKQGQRLAVYSIKEAKGGSVWIKAGSAYLNRDDSLNVYLDVLPIDGKLHIREPRQEQDPKPVVEQQQNPMAPVSESVTVDKLKMEALIEAADRLIAHAADHAVKGYPYMLGPDNAALIALGRALDALTQ